MSFILSFFFVTDYTQIMKLLIMQAIANGYEVLYFDPHEKRWMEFTRDISNDEIMEEEYTFYIKHTDKPAVDNNRGACFSNP